MFMKTTLTAAALATAISAATATLPSAASANPNFSISIETPDGTITFGPGGVGFDADSSMDCWEAKQYLKGEFKHVNKIECNGTVYTFKVKKFHVGPWKTLKLNSDNGAYWFV
jgi:hypothetical protein